MTKKEILDYNRRCAEFLKVPNLKDAKGDLWDFLRTNQKIYSIRTRELTYHSDWNWIMEVCEAIEKLGYYTNILSADNNSMKHTMHINKVHEEEKYTLFVDSKKEAVVRAINQFLIWYNENKS